MASQGVEQLGKLYVVTYEELEHQEKQIVLETSDKREAENLYVDLCRKNWGSLVEITLAAYSPDSLSTYSNRDKDDS